LIDDEDDSDDDKSCSNGSSMVFISLHTVDSTVRRSFYSHW